MVMDNGCTSCARAGAGGVNSEKASTKPAATIALILVREALILMVFIPFRQ
jgi:hypothetical protein